MRFPKENGKTLVHPLARPRVCLRSVRVQADSGRRNLEIRDFANEGS
jgi:hypothetical protein